MKALYILLFLLVAIPLAGAVKSEVISLPFGFSIKKELLFKKQNTKAWINTMESAGIEILPVEHWILNRGVRSVRQKPMAVAQRLAFEKWTDLIDGGYLLGLYTPFSSPEMERRGDPKIFLPRDAYRLVVLHEYIHFLIDKSQPITEISDKKFDRYNLNPELVRREKEYQALFESWRKNVSRVVKGIRPSFESVNEYMGVEGALYRWLSFKLSAQFEADKEELAIDGFLLLNGERFGLTKEELYDLAYTLRIEFSIIEERYREIFKILEDNHNRLQELAHVSIEPVWFSRVLHLQQWTRKMVGKQLDEIGTQMQQFSKEIDLKNKNINSLYLGDLNFDGKITFNDLDLLKELIERPKEHSIITEIVADMNRDSILSSEDIDFFPEQQLSVAPLEIGLPLWGTIIDTKS